MRQEELFTTLIKELFETDGTHYEYQDNDAQYVVDSQKDGNTLTIKVTINENTDKKEFEKWLEQIDDELFSEVLEELEEEGLSNLNEIYSSPNYKITINKVKSKTKEIAERKIKELQKLFA